MNKIYRKSYCKCGSSRKRNLISRTKNSDFSESKDSSADHVMQLQKTLGNQAVQRLMKTGAIQTKLRIGQPNDKYEKEADRVADRVMSMNVGSSERTIQSQPEEDEEVQTKPIIQREVAEEEEPAQAKHIQRQDEDEEVQSKPISSEITPLVQRQEEENELRRKPEEEEEAEIMTKSNTGLQSASLNIQNQLNASKSTGSPLPKDTRNSMESAFGTDFSRVRIHTNSNATQMNQMLNAQAFTRGSDVYFNKGMYNPDTNSGKRLLGHELTHVVQQRLGIKRRLTRGEIDRSSTVIRSPLVQRQESKEEISSKQKINYKKAERLNKKYSSRLGWNTRLAEFRPAWAALWNSNNFNAFADAVAAFQIEQDFKSKSVDGVLGSHTLDRLRPIGEVIAKQRVRWEKSKNVCTIAAQERIVKGYKRATGKSLYTKAQAKTFRIILQSIGSKMKDIDVKYRGTGAAGALVYSGAGEFVNEADIWGKKALKPGAAIQVWGSRKEFEKLKKGKNVNPYGTALVFVKYKGKNKMIVRHFDETQTKKKSDYQVWIGANLNAR